MHQVQINKHDELMVKLMKPETWHELLRIYHSRPCKISLPNTAPYFPEEISVSVEVPVMNHSHIVGYIDVIVLLAPVWYIGCEIKVTEHDLGAAIRQIKKYQQYKNNISNWVVVSSYEEWREPLCSENIIWISSEAVLGI